MSIIDHYSLPDKPPGDFKQLKKELQHALFYFKRLIEDGDRPSVRELDLYRQLSDAFVSFCRRGHPAAAVEIEKAGQALTSACAAADRPEALRAIAELFSIKEKYHAF